MRKCRIGSHFGPFFYALTMFLSVLIVLGTSLFFTNQNEEKAVVEEKAFSEYAEQKAQAQSLQGNGEFMLPPDGGNTVLLHKFTSSSDPICDDCGFIRSIDAIALASPVIDRKLDTEVTFAASTGATCKITWSPADTTAKGSTAYTATLVFTPKAGYHFDERTKVTLEGTSMSVTRLSNGSLRISKSFAKTAAPTNTPTPKPGAKNTPTTKPSISSVPTTKPNVTSTPKPSMPVTVTATPKPGKPVTVTPTPVVPGPGMPTPTVNPDLPTPIPSPVRFPSPTKVPTLTPLPTLSSTPSPTPTSTPTPLPTATSTPAPTSTAVPTATSAPKPQVTSTPAPGLTATPVPTVPGSQTVPTTAPEATKVPSGIPTATPTPEPLPFEDFVERLYVVALDRPSEKAGKDFWIEKVVNGEYNGAECARFFLLQAPEFMNRNLDDSQFVEVLYRTFFDRESEPEGKAYWLGRLASDTPRETIVNEFIESTEWCNICARYGVRSGALYHKAEFASYNAVMFATRLYTCCLDREPEKEGLEYWALALTNLEQTGYDAAYLFFTSKEFVDMKVTDIEYIVRLYQTFMDRDADSEGMQYWLGQLASGVRREQIVEGFACSEEFTNICMAYGIERGEVVRSE